MLRRPLLAGSFIVLVAATMLLWAHRFERVPGLAPWSLADLRPGVPKLSGVDWSGTSDDPVLKLRVDDKTSQVALRLAIPGVPAVDSLHLRYRLAARGLTRGPEKWQSGRIMIEWHPPDGTGKVEMEPVGGIKLDERSGDVALIAVPEEGPAIPSLRLEHLGIAGEFELAGLEITAVRERGLWIWGRWLPAAGFLAWIVACIRSWPGVGYRNALAASVIWLLMGIHFVVPGPWKIQYPLIIGFQMEKAGSSLPSSQAPTLVEATPPPGLSSGAVAPSGEIPVRGGLPLRIKYWIKQIRPLLHILLLCGPTLASTWLIGRRPTLFLAVLLALCIEAAQIAFGYGFDWIDVLDLLTDATGIALGLWLAGRIPRTGELWIAGLLMKRA